MFIHDRDEPIIMMSRKQVHELMHYNVFKAIRRLLCQFEVDPDAARINSARAPFGFHPLNTECRYVDTKALLPLFQQWRNHSFEMLAIPPHHHLSATFNTCTRPHMEFDNRT